MTSTANGLGDLFIRVVMGKTRIDSTLSLNGRLHWRNRKTRTDSIRKAVALMMLGFHAKLAMAEARKHLATGRLVVTLTRTAPRVMDDDNNTSALKCVRDEVAHQLQIDDGDARVRWVCRQETGPWCLTIEIGPVSGDPTKRAVAALKDVRATLQADGVTPEAWLNALRAQLEEGIEALKFSHGKSFIHEANDVLCERGLCLPWPHNCLKRAPTKPEGA